MEIQKTEYNKYENKSKLSNKNSFLVENDSNSYEILNKDPSKFIINIFTI